MELLISNYSSNSVREVVRNGVKYLVAEITMIVPGVLSGSKGPILYRDNDVSASADSWNGMPLTVQHPVINGENVSARSPEVAEQFKVGTVYNCKYIDGKLKAEGWFNADKTKKTDIRVYNALVQGQQMEVSTGLFLKYDEAMLGSQHNGRPYSYVAKEYKPDHLAVLPDKVGACSLQDGCGLHVNQSNLIVNKFTNWLTNNCGKSCKCKKCKEKYKEEDKTMSVVANFANWLTFNCGGKGGTPGPCKTGRANKGKINRGSLDKRQINTRQPGEAVGKMYAKAEKAHKKGKIETDEHGDPTHKGLKSVLKDIPHSSADRGELISMFRQQRKYEEKKNAGVKKKVHVAFEPFADSKRKTKLVDNIYTPISNFTSWVITNCGGKGGKPGPCKGTGKSGTSRGASKGGKAPAPISKPNLTTVAKKPSVPKVSKPAKVAVQAKEGDTKKVTGARQKLANAQAAHDYHSKQYADINTHREKFGSSKTLDKVALSHLKGKEKALSNIVKHTNVVQTHDAKLSKKVSSIQSKPLTKPVKVKATKVSKVKTPSGKANKGQSNRGSVTRQLSNKGKVRQQAEEAFHDKGVAEDRALRQRQASMGFGRKK